MLNLPEDYVLHFKPGVFVNSVECKDRDGHTVEIPALRRKIETYIDGEINNKRIKFEKQGYSGTAWNIFSVLCDIRGISSVKDFDAKIVEVIGSSRFEEHLDWQRNPDP